MNKIVIYIFAIILLIVTNNDFCIDAENLPTCKNFLKNKIHYMSHEEFNENLNLCIKYIHAYPEYQNDYVENKLILIEKEKKQEEKDMSSWSYIFRKEALAFGSMLGISLLGIPFIAWGMISSYSRSRPNSNNPIKPDIPTFTIFGGLTVVTAFGFFTNRKCMQLGDKNICDKENCRRIHRKIIIKNINDILRK